MTRSFRIGRIYGIDIELDYTWFIVFALLVSLLAGGSGPFSAHTAHLPTSLRLLLAVFAAFLFFGSVLLHELSHSLVALRSGMTITGITLFIFGGVSKMADEPRSPGVEFRMAIAGRASFVLAALFYLLALAVGSGGGRSLPEVFLWLAVVNGMLGAFNLLPGFPLDGGRVLRAGLWHWLHNLPEATRIAAGFGQGLGTLLIVLGLLEFMLGGEARWNGVWLAFIGWFVIQAAQSSYQQILARHVLAGITVADIMTRHVDVVPAACTLDEVIHDHVMVHSHPAYPVFDGDRLLGLISLSDLREVPREAPRHDAGERGRLTPHRSSDRLPRHRRLGGPGQDDVRAARAGLLVLEEGRLVGIISRTDVMHVMRRRMELGV